MRTGEYKSAGSGMNTCIYIFFPLDSLIRAMAITYILNRAIHSIILRNRKSHLSNSFLQMSEIKINQSIFWLGWLTISATLLQNRLPLTHTYSKVLRFNLNIWSLIVGIQAKLQTAWNLQYLFMQQTLPYQFCTFSPLGFDPSICAKLHTQFIFRCTVYSISKLVFTVELKAVF